MPPRDADSSPRKRRWMVYCSQFASCRWAGYRKADTRAEALERPCPKCGREVSA